MAFEDTPPTPFISLDKMPAMNRVANSAIYWHSVFEQKRKLIKQSEEKITHFLLRDLKDEMVRFMKLKNAKPEEFDKLLKQLSEDKEHPIIYPYAPENQHIFSNELTELEMAANSVPIILNVQKEMNALPKRMEQQQQQQPQQTGNNFFIGMSSGIKSMFGKKEKQYENVAYVNAYNRSTNLIDRFMQVPVIVSQYNAYHAERVTDCMKFFRGKREPQLHLLYIEYVHYESVVKPLVNNALMETMRLNLLEEKPTISSMLGRGQEQHERRDMMPKFMPE